MSLPPDLRARPLGPSDMTALTELARACDETYLDWAPQGWTVPLPPPNWAEQHFQPQSWTHGAFDGPGRLLGTVAFRPADEDTTIAHLGLVFVHPSRWREGIAGALLTSAEAEMAARGYLREQLWTPEGAPAERFYASRGWTRDGRTDWHPWVGLSMVGYSRDLP